MTSSMLIVREPKSIIRLLKVAKIKTLMTIRKSKSPNSLLLNHLRSVITHTAVTVVHSATAAYLKRMVLSQNSTHQNPKSLRRTYNSPPICRCRRTRISRRKGILILLSKERKQLGNSRIRMFYHPCSQEQVQA